MICSHCWEYLACEEAMRNSTGDFIHPSCAGIAPEPHHEPRKPMPPGGAYPNIVWLAKLLKESARVDAMPWPKRWLCRLLLMLKYRRTDV